MHKLNLLSLRYNRRMLRSAALLLSMLLAMLLLAPARAQTDTPTETPTGEIPASYQLVAENETFQLYADSDTLAFKLRDKRSGYLWESGLDEPIEGDRLNTSWRAFAKSGISIEYFDNRAINRRVSIANTDHITDFTPIDQGFSAQVTFTELEIGFGITVRLEADGIRVEIPHDLIHEGTTTNRLGNIYVYPFLGATRGGSIPGYMLLPDGTGSLIRFADTTRAQTMYYGRYYGPDLGMIGVQPYDELVLNPISISVPVYGMVHGEGQNAYLSVVESGAPYGELQVHPSGVITNFNFLYNAFIYNETYFQHTNRAGAGVTTLQRDSNAFDAVVHYRFLTGDQASYIGMARSYQQYLVDEGMLRAADAPNSDIGIRLEFLGGDKEQVLFWNRFVPMTTISQMRDIVTSFQFSNPEVIYYGWQPYGAATMPPSSLTIDGALGSTDDLLSLNRDITDSGGHFSLYYDPLAAFYQEGGYSERYDPAMAITDVNIEAFNRLYEYLFSLNPLRERFRSLSGDVASQNGPGLALDDIGFMLFSDFRNGAHLSRTEAVAAYQALMSDTSLRLSFYRPNDYLFSFANAYYDMPLSDNGYIYTSESVPFLPAVLAGYLPYYGTPLNFSSNRQNDVLRQVEYGIYPSYFVTSAPTADMLNTRSAWIFTSSYAQWGDQIRSTYEWMNALLGPVRGQSIVAHEQLADDVFATTYANGRQIIVNYTDQPVTVGGVTVEAQNAVLLENRP